MPVVSGVAISASRERTRRPAAELHPPSCPDPHEKYLPDVPIHIGLLFRLALPCVLLRPCSRREAPSPFFLAQQLQSSAQMKASAALLPSKIFDDSSTLGSSSRLVRSALLPILA